MVTGNHFRLAGVALLAVLLTGCGFFQKRVDQRDNAYRSTVEHAPLKVPDGLETPGTATALAVPPITATGSAEAGIAPPHEIGPSGVQVPLGELELAVSDTVDNTWRRVGEALAASGVASVVSRDAAQATWHVQMSVEVASEAGAMRRLVTLGRAGRPVQKTVQLVIKVLADEGLASIGAGSSVGSVVQILGSPGAAGEKAAAKLFAALQENLS